MADRLENLALLASLLLACVLVAGAMYLWKERADTAPRHSARAIGVGYGASFAVLVLVSFLPTVPVDQPWRDLLTAGLVAAPVVLAGLWILFRR